MSLPKSKKLISSATASSPVVITDVKSAIRKLFYDQTQAFGNGAKAGIAFVVANDYPAAFDVSSSVWKKNTATYRKYHYNESLVPDLTTVSPDPTWKLGKSKCNPAQTSPPKGRTFVVTANDSETLDGYTTQQKTDLHVTLLSGRPYFYFDYCG